MRFGAAILFEEAGAGQKKSAEWKTEKKEGGTDRGKKKKIAGGTQHKAVTWCLGVECVIRSMYIFLMSATRV